MDIAMSGWQADSDQPASFFFVTLTAPGSRTLPWDRSQCTHDPSVRCSGKLGCRVDDWYGARWNGQAPKRWSYVRQYLVRELGVDVQCFGTWEWQERGVLHRHFIVRTERPFAKNTMRRAVAHLRTALGFGPQIDVRAITLGGVREVMYLAKYATKTADDIDGRRLIDARTGEVKEARGFRPWSCSRRWGMTMQEAKERQRSWVMQAIGGGAHGRPTSAGDAGGGALDPDTSISTDGAIEEDAAPPSHQLISPV